MNYASKMGSNEGIQFKDSKIMCGNMTFVAVYHCKEGDTVRDTDQLFYIGLVTCFMYMII